GCLYAYYGFAGKIALDATTISGNSSGAIAIGGGELAITNSTVSGNVGGAISVLFSQLTVSNSTIADNTSNYFAGLYAGGGSTVDIANSTISGNSGKLVGGIYVSFLSGYGSISMNSTIVAGNSGQRSPDIASHDQVTIGGDYDLVGIYDATQYTLTGTHNKT